MKKLTRERKTELIKESLRMIFTLSLEFNCDLKSMWLNYVELRYFWENCMFLNTKVEVSSIIE
jgi:hypothetical protein